MAKKPEPKKAGNLGKRKPAPPKPASAKKDVDWKRVEADYRAGIKTLRAIGSEHGVSHVAIQKRAKQFGWEQDLAERIRLKAEAKVNKAAVTSLVTKEDEKQVVEANAQLQADVILSHRRDVVAAREVCVSLLGELKASTLAAADLVALADWVSTLDSDDAKAAERVRKAVMDAMELPSRAAVMGKLAESLTKLVTLERTVFGIEKENGGELIEDRLRRLED